MTHPLSEAALIEQPALSLLASLGWEAVNAYHEVPGAASLLGRETSGEVAQAAMVAVWTRFRATYVLQARRNSGKP